jgi:hypothetical protein
LVSAVACAATNTPVIVNPNAWGGIEFTTNWFATNTHWRASDGRIYNTRYSEDFKKCEGTCIEVITNGLLLVERRWTEPLYHTTPGYSHGPRSSGNFIGGGNVPARKTTIGEEQKSERFLVTNAPSEIVLGWKVDVWAIFVRSDPLRGERLSVYDCGTTPTPAEIEKLRQRFLPAPRSIRK